MAITTDVGPVGQGERIGALDVLRGVAVCGILLMNIPLMGMAFDTGRPHYPVAVNADWIAFSLQNTLFEGSMRGLFTLLFGAGMLIMLRGGDAGGGASAQAWFTRCFALMLLGVANFAIFLWPGEILTNYGLAGILLYLFRRADRRMLVTASLALLAVTTIYFTAPSFERAETLRQGAVAAQLKADGKTLTEDQQKALDGRQETLDYLHPKPEKVKEEVARRTSFPGVLVWSTQTWVEYNLSDLSLAFLAETVSFMLLGLLLFRMGVLSGEKSLGFYGLMALGGYGIGLAIRGAQLAWGWINLFEPTPEGQITGGLAYELGGSVPWSGGNSLSEAGRGAAT